MTQFYLASRYDRAAEINEYAEQLEYAGHRVVSTWHRNALDIAYVPGEGAEFAITDLHDMKRADAMIQFTGGEHSHGRHAELGWALRDGMYVIFVGPREGVYHDLPMWVWYSDWSEVMRSLADPWHDAYLRAAAHDRGWIQGGRGWTPLTALR